MVPSTSSEGGMGSLLYGIFKLVVVVVVVVKREMKKVGLLGFIYESRNSIVRGLMAVEIRQAEYGDTVGFDV